MQKERPQEKITTWIFEPLVAVRSDRVGEVAFLRRWQKMMSVYPLDMMVREKFGRISFGTWEIENNLTEHPFPELFSEMRDFVPRARDAAVATSLIVWLGTQSGVNFLRKAQDLAAHFNGRSEPESCAHLSAWAEANMPFGVSLNNTPREYIMGGKKLNGRDMQVMEAVVRWLGDEDGIKFVRSVQKEIVQREQNALQAARSEHLAARGRLVLA